MTVVVDSNFKVSATRELGASTGTGVGDNWESKNSSVEINDLAWNVSMTRIDPSTAVTQISNLALTVSEDATATESLGVTVGATVGK